MTVDVAEEADTKTFNIDRRLTGDFKLCSFADAKCKNNAVKTVEDFEAVAFEESQLELPLKWI